MSRPTCSSPNVGRGWCTRTNWGRDHLWAWSAVVAAQRTSLGISHPRTIATEMSMLLALSGGATAGGAMTRPTAVQMLVAVGAHKQGPRPGHGATGHGATGHCATGQSQQH